MRTGEGVSEVTGRVAGEPFLDGAVPIPLYHQLYTVLRGKIESGEWAAGTFIPSEARLSGQYDISRTTVRQAVLALVREGYLSRTRGRGTVVRDPKMVRQTPGWMSFTEEMRAMGRVPGAKLLQFGVLPKAPPVVRQVLGLRPGEAVIRLVRTRSADGELLGVSVSFVRKALWDRLQVHPEDLSDRSLYALLEERLGIRLVRARETIEAAVGDPDLAGLPIPQSLPILRLTRVVYASDGSVIEYGSNKFRGDRYEVGLLHVRGQTPAGGGMAR